MLRAIRKAKSAARLSMRAEVRLVTVGGTRAGAVEPALGDLAAAGHAARIDVRPDGASAGGSERAAGDIWETAQETAEGSGLYVAAEFC